MYRRIDEQGDTLSRHFTAQQAAAALQSGDLVSLTESLYNIFEQVNDLPELSETRRLLLQSGAAAAQMTGSGSAVFGLYRTGEQAQAAARSLSRQRWAVFCHSTEGEEAAW